MLCPYSLPLVNHTLPPLGHHHTGPTSRLGGGTSSVPQGLSLLTGIPVITLLGCVRAYPLFATDYELLEGVDSHVLFCSCSLEVAGPSPHT